MLKASRRDASLSQTFLSQLLVVDQLAMSQVVENGAEVGRVSVYHISAGLILSEREKGVNSPAATLELVLALGISARH